MSLVLLDSSVLTQETRLWLSFLPTRPSYLTIKSVDNFIKAAKSHGYWNLFDRFWLFAQDKQVNAVYSIKNPTSTPGTEVNSPSHTAYQGYTNTGTSYIDTNYNPATQGVNYTLNNAHIGLYSLTSGIVPSGNAHAAIDAGLNNTMLLPRFTGSVSVFRINQATATSISGANTNGTGLYLSQRTASNANAGFKNGVSLVSGSDVSTSIPSLNLYILGRNNNGTADAFWLGGSAAASTGASLAGYELLYYNDFNTYLKTPLGF